MHLTGFLDCRSLFAPLAIELALETSGIHLKNTGRTRVTRSTHDVTVSIGELTTWGGSGLPLATVSRIGNQFILAVPGYSFLTVYFARRGDQIHWSTHLNTLARSIGSVHSNTSYEGFGLKYQFWPGAETVYAGIHKVRPGKQLEVSSQSVRISDHAPVQPPLPPEIDPEDTVAVDREIHDRLIEGVDRLSSEHQLTGVMLGGFDSALIVALLAELGRPIHAVTFGYTNQKYNQPHIAPLVKRYGASHEWVDIEPEIVRQGLHRYADFFDQPVTQPHYLISNLHLSRTLAERGVTQTLTGDGCDGVFFGYPTVFKKAKLVRALRQVPTFVKPPLKRLLEAAPVERLAGHPARIARQLLEVTSRPKHLQSFLTSMAVDTTSAQRAMPLLPPQENSLERERLEALFQENVSGKDWIDITYFSKNMVGLNRAKLASSWNHSGLQQIFSPYMLPDVTSLANAIPKQYWINEENPSGKDLLVNMALRRKLLSKDIVYQKKMSPVASPMDDWLRHELRSDVLDMAAKSPILNDRYCAELLQERFLETWFRRKITIDDYTSHVLGMLLSYSRMVDKE